MKKRKRLNRGLIILCISVSIFVGYVIYHSIQEKKDIDTVEAMGKSYLGVFCASFECSGNQDGIFENILNAFTGYFEKEQDIQNEADYIYRNILFQVSNNKKTVISKEIKKVKTKLNGNIAYLSVTGMTGIDGYFENTAGTFEPEKDSFVSEDAIVFQKGKSGWKIVSTDIKITEQNP